jgi:hypothetical protein
MSLLYFGLAVFCHFKDKKVPEFDAVFNVECPLYKGSGVGYVSNSGTPAPNRQNSVQLVQNTMRTSLC